MDECPTLEQLRLWLAGRLIEADRRVIDRHVRSCPRDCRQRIKRLKAAANATTGPIGDGNRQNEPTPPLAARSGRNQTNASEAGEAALPRQFGRFKIVELLGKGSYGEVYRARDPKLNREVAIKLPRKGLLQEPAERERFLREARALAKLRHRHICQVFDVGEWKDRQYIVMELVSGQSLETVIARSGRIGERTVAATLRKLALALDEAHRAGIIHRDLKPSNIILDERGQPIVMDFGLARRFDPNEATLTQTGAIVGTPAYMAPEQAQAHVDEIGPATDVYALGIILYEMLAGSRPFAGDLAEVRRQIVDVQPVAPSALRPGLDPRLEAICLKAIAKAPSDRFSSMRELAEALRPLVKPDATKDHPTNPLESEEFASLVAGLDSRLSVIAQRQRVPWWRWTAAVVPVVLALLLGWFLIPRGPSTREVRLIVDEALRADASLSFFLDGHEITAQQAGEKMQLAFGDHLLVVKRASDVIKTYYFVVPPNSDDVPSGSAELAENVRLREIPEAVVAKVPDAVGHWGFDEITDAAKREHPGVRGQAMRFSSSADAIAIPDSPSFHANAAVTVAAWIQPKSDRAGRIAGKWSSPAKGCYALNWVDGVYSFRVAFPVGGTMGTAVEVHALGAVGDWAHVVGVYDGKRLCVYIDGQPVASQELARSELLRRTGEFATTRRIPSALRDSPDPFGIGGEGFQGLIDEVQVWDSALSLQQVVTLFDSFADMPPVPVEPQTGLGATADADRLIAEWVISRGGSVSTVLADGSNSPDRQSTDDLPSDPFSLASVNLFDELSPNDADLTRLNELPQLRGLVIMNAELITDEAMISFVHSHPMLQWVAIWRTGLSGASFEALCERETLFSLVVQSVNLADADTHHLRKQSGLSGLGLLWAPRVTDASLTHVAQMSGLVILNLTGTSVTDEGLSRLPQLLSIQGLDLSQTATGDSLLARLGESLRLSELNMRGTKLTDAGLAPLARIRTLRELNIGDTVASDSAVLHLKHLHGLTKLNVSHTRLTSRAVDELRTVLPRCKIISDFDTLEPLATPPTRTLP